MARAALGLGIRELADASQTSTDTILRLERGETLRPRTVAAVRQALEAAGVLFIPEDRHGPGVRLLRTSAIEGALAALVELHANDAQLDRVEVIAAGFSAEDRDAIAAAFGNRAWGEPRREADARGCEIQDRLVFPERFHS